MKVVYFTRSQNSKRIGQKLAKSLDCSLVELKDDKDWSGLWGYMKAGFYTIKNKDVTISLSESIDSSEDVVLVAPLWAGGPAQAARRFIESRDNKITLVLSSQASVFEKNIFKNVLSITTIPSKKGNEDSIVSSISEKLLK
jgi:hypothetical protein